MTDAKRALIVYDRVSLTLRKTRRRTDVLEDCSAVVPSDRRVGLLAHRQTGKTCVLQLAAGGLTPDRGRVTRSGLVSYTVGSARLFNQKLSLRENIVFACRLYGFDPRPIITFVDERLDLGLNLDRPFGIISRELKRSALFLVSYAMPFDLYCIDENPVAGSPEMKDLLDTIVWQRAESSGLFIASSTPRVLARYCDVFFILKDRTLIEVPDLETAVELLGPPPKRLAPVVDEEEREADGDEDEFLF